MARMGPILEAHQPRQNHAQMIGDMLSEGLNSYFQKQSMSESMQRENEALKKSGIDVSGISDPKLRQLYVSAQLQGANAQELQKIKDFEKNERRQQSQEFVQNLYQRGQTEPSKGDQLSSGGNEAEEFNERGSSQRNPILDVSDEEIAQATLLDPNLGRTLQSQKDVALREGREERDLKERADAEERRNRTAKEKAYFKFNEPKLAEVAGLQRKINSDNARFTKMGNLFEQEDQFPSEFLTALVTKDGTINDLAYSQLTPTAQEAVKLIIDSTSGIKDTYGARVTNFDLQTYLRKLPSLLTSPEGRRRIVHDLKGMNEINQVYNEGIQDIFEKAGGSDKIAFSEAERRFQKEYGKEIQRKIEKYISPEGKNFTSMPSPKRYLGKKIKDEETGEIFISDGNEWKPFKG